MKTCFVLPSPCDKTYFLLGLSVIDMKLLMRGLWT